jgi:hypothetical protein
MADDRQMAKPSIGHFFHGHMNSLVVITSAVMCIDRASLNTAVPLLATARIISRNTNEELPWTSATATAPMFFATKKARRLQSGRIRVRTVNKTG